MSNTALPRQVSNQVLRVLHRNWKSFFAAQKAYNLEPSKFVSRPQPKYYGTYANTKVSLKNRWFGN
jgi:putative transposase